MQNYKYNLTPSTFEGTWNLNVSISGYNTRAANNIHQEAFELHQFKRHPIFNLPKKCNEIPNHLKNIACTKTFNKELKAHLLEALV